MLLRTAEIGISSTSSSARIQLLHLKPSLAFPGIRRSFGVYNNVVHVKIQNVFIYEVLKYMKRMKSAGELQKPEGPRLNSKRPTFVMNAVYFLLLYPTRTWEKPFSKSIMVNIFAISSFSSTFSTIGTGKQSFNTILFNWR